MTRGKGPLILMNFYSRKSLIQNKVLFYLCSMQLTAGQIAELVGGSVTGDPDVKVSGPSRIEDGKPGTITFLANPKYKDYLYTTQASVVLVQNSFVPEQKLNASLITVDNVYASLALLMARFNSGISLAKGIAASACVDETVTIGEGVSIDEQVIIRPGSAIGNSTRVYGQVFIGDNVRIGSGCTIYPGVKIYHNCVIGDHCTIHANTVIGSDGFGFTPDENGNFVKIPQTGNVVIEDYVEIGSNVVIDRASIGSTLIKRGVKLDNLIQVAHNVTIGENTVIAAQAGIAGSTRIGSGCMIGGQVGIVGHIEVADGVMIQAQSGVASPVKQKGAKLYGSPAIDYQNYLKSYALFRRLPEVNANLNELKSNVGKLLPKDQL